MRTTAVIVLALAVVFTACDGKKVTQRPTSGAASPSTTAYGDGFLRFMESTSGSLEDGVSAIATSLAIESKRPVRITAVEAVADPGLKVTYLGYSYCLRGCAGVSPWNADTEATIRSGLDGTVPLEVPTDGKQSRPSLTFLMERVGPGFETIRQRCLRVTAVKLTLDDKSTVLLTVPNHVVTGLRASDRGPDYRDCFD